MALKKNRTGGVNWKEVLAGQEDFMKELVRLVLQEALDQIAELDKHN